MWSYGAIAPSWSIEIASKDNASENLWILWRYVKIKKYKSGVINHIHEEVSFLGKNAVFMKNENEFLKNSYFGYTWSYDHIQQVFKISERSDQYSRRYDILKSYPFRIALCFIVSIQNNVIPIGSYFKLLYHMLNSSNLIGQLTGWQF